MRKRCKECGKEFEAKDLKHDTCHECFQKRKSKKDNVDNYLLQNYYDKEGNLIKDVFIGIPEDLAKLFSNSDLSSKQLREFFFKIKKARNTAFLKGMEKARPLLWECFRDIEYQHRREIIPYNFHKFMKHHLSLAEKDQNSLEGFCEHLESILAYFTKEKGGEA